jgi:uncharacterized protein (TIGR03435 family)
MWNSLRRIDLKRVMLFLLSLLVFLVVRAQAPAPQLAYDVITIKPNDSGSGDTSTSMEYSSFQASNVPIKRLLVRAYGIKQDLISGLPDWTNTARFDVNAKVVDPDEAALKKLTPEQRRGFILAMLRDRFHLKVHFETKTLPVYELLVTKDGPKFHASAAGEEHSMGTDSDGTKTQLKASNVTMAEIAGLLTNQADRTVLDRTGLAAKYDVLLKWTDDRGPGAADNGLATEEIPGLFTAIQEQLGLRLQPGKGPVQTLVVDHVERPTEN